MPIPILATKLYIPPSRSNLVPRPHLIERLNEGLRQNHGFERKLTLISAPAGFGKTTLVSEWISQRNESRRRTGESGKAALHPSSLILHPPQVTWLSLDEGDNEPFRFLAYLVAALQTIAADIGEAVLQALQSPQPPPIELLLTTLLNDLAARAGSFLLILDDYHVIDSPPVDQALTFLLEHLPPQIHLVIATREDPDLPLARYRARGQLTELRAADLRFSSAEAAEFLNQVMGLNLSAEEIAALEAPTEGWIAGLQLAALSMQGREDIASFIQAFTGSHRFVLDYLVEEVLLRQPERVRSFLLQTSILDRFCAPLCNAVCSVGTGVTEREDGKEMLDVLERNNLFLIPLDDQRQWYRYHHLFAEVLLAHLMGEQSDHVPNLHRRASVWFEQNDLPADAIRHALTAKDFDRAAELIERVWLEMDLSYQSATWLGWAKALPEEMIRARPVVSVGYAWALLGVGELEASEARLRDAERWLEPADKQAENSAARMVIVDEVEFRSLPASIAAARAYCALALGDLSNTKKYARQALALAPEDESIHRTQATALLGLAEYASGDLQAAEQELLKFQAIMWRANDIANAIGITFILANIKLVQGRLHEAASAYRQSLELAASQGVLFFLGASDLYRGLSELLCEQGDLEAAAQHLLTAQQLGERGATTGWPHRLRVAQARMKQTQGDVAGALDLLDEAEHLYIRNPLPDRPVAALKARTWIRQGQLTKALSWVHEQNLSPDDDLSYLREFEHITLARVLIARYKSDRVDDSIHAAMRLLKRLLQAAEEGRRTGSVIEILVLQALAHEAQDHISMALAPLERALALAGPEGYVQIFVDEGLPMVALLRAAAKHSITPNYVSQLLAAFGKAESRRPVTQPLIEPLSERELEVLRLLRTELSGPEIARELVVSLNTMRTHTKSIFNKLGVNNRRAAVRRAEELDLL